eukprot:m51a1_g5751 hypothetical protein (1631) ;mRNA; r:1185475-1190493
MSDAAALPTEAHGVWHARLLDAAGATELGSSLWVLCLTSSPSPPSAFGASSTPPGDATSPAAATSVRVLHGRWSPPPANVLALAESVCPGDAAGLAPLRTFAASLALASDGASLVLRGTWAAGGAGGVLVAALEADEGLRAGLWVGQSDPAPELAALLVPSNPIRWALAAPASCPAFGAGFFDDAADVPGKPVLFFTLQGGPGAAAQSEFNSQFLVTKKYEAAARAGDVAYACELDGRRLSGRWDNASAGTWGSFECSLVASGAGTSAPAAVCACDACGRPVLPGDARWTCALCVPCYSCCAQCHCGGAAVLHPHALTAETTYVPELARGATVAALVRDSLARFAGRPFVGVRSGGAFEWRTYAEVGAEALAFSAGLRKALAGAAEWAAEPRPRVVLLDDVGPEYVVATLGAIDAGMVLVPVHGETDADALARILSSASPSAVVATRAELRQTLAVAMRASSVDCLVVDDVQGFARSSLGERPELLEPPRGLESVGAVLFTSGSTGEPKGVAFTEELMMPSEGASNVQPFVRLDFQRFDPSFALSLLSTLLCGGQRAFSSVGSVHDDMRVARPTHFGAPPAFWQSLYRDWSARVSQLRSTGCGAEEAEETATNEARASLGNRLVVATSGGAPLSDEVSSFIRGRLRIALADLYGTRETGGIARDGVVLSGVDVLLVPVPELSCEGDPASGPSAREIGRTYRGEICVRSPRVVPGYWSGGAGPARPEASWVEAHGLSWYRTGDVGELSVDAAGRRLLRVVDRHGGSAKLAQGEWISPSRIESIIEECPVVRQALVLASPAMRFPVAVIVPSEGNEDVSAEEALRAIRVWCSHRKLRPLEIPQAVAIEKEPWTPENGLLTSTEKKRRETLVLKYRELRDRLYESTQTAMSGVAGPAESTLSEEFRDILAEALSSKSAAEAAGSQTLLSELGGDSLVASRLVRLLKTAGVELTIGGVFEYPLGHLSELLGQAKAGHFSACRPVDAATRVDWDAECALPPDIPAARKRLDTEPRNVLLTGATGFLGPFLARDILESRPQSVRLLCLVRGPSDAAAQARLIAEMKRASLWKPEYGPRVRVYCGDVSKAFMGLEASTYGELAAGVSEVVHNAAVVSMAMPYSAMRPTNVVGTANVIRFAACAGASVRHVSSIGALVAGESGDEEWPRAAPGRISEGKSAYGQTKAVAERLMAQASRHLGLEVSLFRPTVISGAVESGFSNVSDFSCLAALACLALGSYPEAAAGNNLGWIPVDVVSRAVATLNGPAVFHLVGSGPTMGEVVEALGELARQPLQKATGQAWEQAVARLPQLDARFSPVVSALQALGVPREGVARVAPATRGVKWEPPSGDYIRECLRSLALFSAVGGDLAPVADGGSLILNFAEPVARVQRSPSWTLVEDGYVRVLLGELEEPQLSMFADPFSKRSIAVRGTRIATGQKAAIVAVFVKLPSTPEAVRCASTLRWEGPVVSGSGPLAWQHVARLPWGKPFEKDEFYNSANFRVLFGGLPLCAVQFWAAGLGVNCGLHDHGDATPETAFCEIHVGLHNGSGAGGMVWTPSGDPTRSEGIPIMQGEEHGRLWLAEGPPSREAPHWTRSGAVLYPMHKWQSGGSCAAAQQAYDVWAAFEHAPDRTPGAVSV